MQYLAFTNSFCVFCLYYALSSALRFFHPVECDPAAGFETSPAFCRTHTCALLYNRIALRICDLSLYIKIRTRTLADIERVCSILAHYIRLERFIHNFAVRGIHFITHRARVFRVFQYCIRADLAFCVRPACPHAVKLLWHGFRIGLCLLFVVLHFAFNHF